MTNYRIVLEYSQVGAVKVSKTIEHLRLHLKTTTADTSPILVVALTRTLTQFHPVIFHPIELRRELGFTRR